MVKTIQHLYCSILFLRQNPALTGGDSERGLQIPIKVFYWISTSQQRLGSEAAGLCRKRIQYHKQLAHTLGSGLGIFGTDFT